MLQHWLGHVLTGADGDPGLSAFPASPRVRMRAFGHTKLAFGNDPGSFPQRRRATSSEHGVKPPPSCPLASGEAPVRVPHA